MVQVAVGQQQVVYGCRVESDIFGVILRQLAAALIQATIDENFLSRAFNLMAGTGDTLIGTVK